MADLSDSVNWSETDSSNNKASPLGWPEGMMPSGVNDSARADKGALKRFWDRINPVQGLLPVGGVWTFTTSNIAYPTSYVTGEVYCFHPNADGVGGDQFQVNALGPKPIWKHLSSSALGAIVAKDIVAGVAPHLVFDASINGGAGAFVLLNPFLPLASDGAGGISVQGVIAAAGQIATTGADAGFHFDARDGAAPTSWTWYATGGLARLNAAGFGDRVTIDGGGSLSAAGYLSAGSNITSGNDLHLGGDFILFAGNTSLASGPLISGDTANFYTRLGPGNGGWYWQNSGGANVMTLTSAGALTTASPIYTTGANAALVFYDRTNSAASWVWYATGGAARLNNTGGADQAVFDSLGAHLVSNLYLGGTYILFNGATAGGPYIVADGTNMSFALGPANGGFNFDKNDGTNVARIDAGGNIYGWDIHAGGTLTAQYVNASASIAAPFIHSTGNVQADSAFTGGSVSVSGNITSTSGGTVAGAFIHSTGNVQADSAFTGGSISVTGAITASGDIHAAGDLYLAGTLRGGMGQDVGVLHMAPTGADPNSHTVFFGWDAFGGAFYRITDGSTVTMLVSSSGSGSVRSLLLQPDGGTPSGWRLAVQQSSSSYFIYVDFTTSDARMKRGIGDTEVDALAAICAVPVRRFEWRKEVRAIFGAPPLPVKIGLVAQDLLPHMPDVVGISEGREKPYPADTHTLMYDRIHAYTIRAIQQLEARVAQLESK